MAGGTWSPMDMPVLPGLFMKFIAAAIAAIQPGARGVVAQPVRAHWGPIGEFKEITSVQQILDLYTDDITNGANAYTSLYLGMLGKPKKILPYRLASTAAAAATTTLVDNAVTPANAILLEGIFKGARGNKFRVTVQTNPVNSSKKDIKFYEGTDLLYTFTFTSGTMDAVVSAINTEASSDNVWIKATKLNEGTGILANVTAQAFTGGDSGITGIASSNYTSLSSSLETQTFNLLALDAVTDESIQTLISAWIQRVRDEGMGVMSVMGGSGADDIAADAVAKAVARSAGFNHEGIVNVGTGNILDGVSYSSAEIACYVAGLIAGTKLAASTTYAPTAFDDVTRRWTRSEQEAAINGGVFIMYHDGKIVKPLRGINSLTTLRQGQGEAWKTIRGIRVMDAINADLQSTAEANYIGKINNNASGRQSLIGAFKQYMELLASDGVIEAEGWDVYLDPDYYGATKKIDPQANQVFTAWDAILTDVMEQIFGKFTVH